ncbi:hypothetical protein A0H81_01627 [Grifola frondosa]|uniref:Uncharacterized protein n=1 Tax=Grifola frondosa TaxID=5627 RepID=A0A1C7MK37_GRIFR|nr:hypothetical protein A0H81_01627 [Grifola frondosa]
MPPPTSNLLDSRQRTRLIRSTRKLGEMLGTTPQLVETDHDMIPIPITLPLARPQRPKHHPSRRQGSIFTLPSSANSSATSLAFSTSSAASTSSESLPRPKAPSKRTRTKALPSPLVLRLNATRRRRIAKLKRTLGENVPIELVLPIRPPPTSPVMPQRPAPFAHARRRSMSVDIENTARSSRVWVTGTGEWNRKDIREVQQRLRGLKSPSR